MASIRCNCLYRKMLHLRTLYLPLHIFQKMVAVPVPVFFINKIVISIQIELIHPKYHRNVFRLPLFFIGIAIAHAELRVPLLSQSRYARILSEAGIPAVRHPHHIHLPPSRITYICPHLPLSAAAAFHNRSNSMWITQASTTAIVTAATICTTFSCCGSQSLTTR
ncbi:unknown [Firmicutes bacterium CAG:24]|nr:unknown [Firmicutes bacterium CAG:24]